MLATLWPTSSRRTTTEEDAGSADRKAPGPQVQMRLPRDEPRRRRTDERGLAWAVGSAFERRGTDSSGTAGHSPGSVEGSQPPRNSDMFPLRIGAVRARGKRRTNAPDAATQTILRQLGREPFLRWPRWLSDAVIYHPWLANVLVVVAFVLRTVAVAAVLAGTLFAVWIVRGSRPSVQDLVLGVAAVSPFAAAMVWGWDRGKGRAAREEYNAARDLIRPHFEEMHERVVRSLEAERLREAGAGVRIPLWWYFWPDGYDEESTDMSRVIFLGENMPPELAGLSPSELQEVGVKQIPGEAAMSALMNARSAELGRQLSDEERVAFARDYMTRFTLRDP